MQVVNYWRNKKNDRNRLGYKCTTLYEKGK